MNLPTSSVLIPSYRRPDALGRCLKSLSQQSHPPDEVIVIWQADDSPTNEAAESARLLLGDRLKIVHSATTGVIPAENAGLMIAAGEIILLIDDDAEAPSDWVARHLSHYFDASIGAVGGPAVNHHPDGTPFPLHANQPIGRFTRYGKTFGNMYDQPPEWRSRAPVEVDHLVGYNLSLRRLAFDHFENSLRPYWQLFELEACLQVRSRHFRVIFDYGNVVHHHPTNSAYSGGRDGNSDIKIFNPAYNHAFITSKHLRGGWRMVAWTYAMAIGSVNTPGLLAATISWKRYGNLMRELAILRRTWAARAQGWRDGRRSRLGRLTEQTRT